MAFNKSNAQRSNNTDTNANGDASWKAQGYLNLYLPSKTSKNGQRKLAGIPLKDSVTSEKAMREWIEKNPTAACDAILRGLRIEYQAADNGAGFDFDAMGAAPTPPAA